MIHFTKEQVRMVIRDEAMKKLKRLREEMTVGNAAVLMPQVTALEKYLNEERGSSDIEKDRYS